MPPKLLTGAVAAVAMLCYRSAVTAVDHRSTSKPTGRFCASQISRHAEPVIAVLSSGKGYLAITPFAVIGQRPGGASHEMWLVDAQSPTSGYQVHTIWDAQNGNLISVSRSTVPSTGSSRSLLRESDAVRISGSWLASLGIASEDAGWRADAHPTHNESVWHVTWRAGKCHKVEMVLDVRTGELVLAENVTPFSEPNYAVRVAARAAAGLHKRS